MHAASTWCPHYSPYAKERDSMLECVGTLEYQAHHPTKSEQALRIALALTLAAPHLTSTSFTPFLSTNVTTNDKTVSNRKELQLKDRGLPRPLDMHDHRRITANKNGNTANQQSSCTHHRQRASRCRLIQRIGENDGSGGPGKRTVTVVCVPSWSIA